MPSREEVIAVLRSVAGPDGRTPLPDSGAISGLTMREGKVFLAILVAPSEARKLEPMRARAEAEIKALPGVTGAVVTLTAESGPLPAAAPAQGHAPPRPYGGGIRPAAPIPGVRHIIAVASGKGGVGKSTVACNVAVALAGLGFKVGVLDADLFGPSMPRLFGLSARPQLAPDGQKLMPLESFGVRVMSIGFLVDEGAPVIWRGPMVMSALNQLLREVVWGELDALIVDMPPGTGDTQLTMAQNVPLSGAVIVSTPQDLALIDARRGIAMFNKTQVPIIGVVENMSYFVCPHCGGRTDIFSHGGARKEAETLGVPFLGEAPLNIAIRENSDGGRPVVAALPDSAEAAAFIAIARAIGETLTAGAPGAKPAPRIRIV